MRWQATIAQAAAALLVLASCSAGSGTAAPAAPSETGATDGSQTPAPNDAASLPAVPPAPSPSPTVVPSPSPSPSPPAPGPTDAELAALGVNELGRVLVGEWHLIGDVDGQYQTSRDTFREQLQALYDRGYRPVTQLEFLTGRFPIPAGTSPLLLTFDDSTRGQFALDEDGVPVPDTAVGILEAFAAEHPDWRATAVFAFNFPDPFGDGDFARKLEWLVDNGYELSNHSLGHVNLSTLSSGEVEANLAENQARLHAVVPDAPLPALTLTLGIWPDDRSVALAGTGPDGTTYRHELVYLVGSDPTRSPHHVEFDPTAVQRVPAHAVAGTGPEWFWDWLDRLDDDELRYVSDGEPDVVTFPHDLADVAAVDPALSTRSYGAP